MHKQRLAIALGVGVAWSASAGAQAMSEEDQLAAVYGDKTTLTIATGAPLTLRRAPSVATVITAEDIAATGATDLDEILETVPGVHVSRTGYYAPIFSIRGIQSNPTDSRTLLLQNGVPMTTMYLGDKGQNWGGMPLENIARIEIIRGPGSALYGADAYAGVINLITKTAADIQGTEAGARAGSFSTWDTWVLHGDKHGPFDVAAYLRIGSTDGFKETIAADAQSARDRRFGTHASLAPGPVETGRDAIDGGLDVAYDNWRLRVGYKQRDHLGLGAGIASALDPQGQHRSERINTDLSWNDPRFTADWGLGFTASFLHYAETLASNYRIAPPRAVFPTGSFPVGMIGNPDRYERQLRVSAFATYSGFRNHRLRGGLGHDDLDLYDTGTHKNYLLTPRGPVPFPASGEVIDYDAIQPHLTPQRRRVNYLYVQEEWDFAQDWTLTAGIRHDSYSDFGGTTNPRLSLVWDAALDLTFKLLYGQAFRAPSFNEQYGTNPVASGNPSLTPETIRTMEAAVVWQAAKDVQTNLSVFHYEMDNIIRVVPNAGVGTGGTYQNVGRQHGNGFELEGVWDVSPRLRLSAHYGYQASTDEQSGKDAGYAPRQRLYARADWQFAERARANVQVNHVADRHRAAGDPRPPIDDYTTVDMTLRTKLGRRDWNFAASVRNLFDAEVREPSLAPPVLIPEDLPMAPRTIYLQAILAL